MESFTPCRNSDVKEEEEENNENNTCKMIATLPRGNGWGISDHLCKYQGFWYIPNILKGVISAQQNFKLRSSDIILSSAPKSGTTWLKALTFSIATRTQFGESTSPLLTKLPHECVPFYEVDFPNNLSNLNSELPLISTHAPYSCLPKSMLDSGCKIIYICRDPKGVFISLWYYCEKKRPKDKNPLPLEDAFELFCEGVSLSGPYWDHVLGYWKASLELPNRILFLRYEDVKNESLYHVKRLAEFMGYPFSLEEEKQGAVQKVIEFCSFKNLSNLKVNKTGKWNLSASISDENNTYFRKGEIGDWKNHLTTEMAARLDQIVENKFKGSGLTLNF